MKETITLESRDLDFIKAILDIMELRNQMLLQISNDNEYFKIEFDRIQEVIANLNEARGIE